MKSSLFIKSYALRQQANPGKQDKLFQFYRVYSHEYQKLVHLYWSHFIRKEVKDIVCTTQGPGLAPMTAKNLIL